MHSILGLYISANQLSGTLPPELGNITGMTSLILQENMFSGSIPTEIGNLSSIAVMYVYSNALSHNIPRSIGLLSTLVELYLQYNYLTGPVGDTFGTALFPQLTSLLLQSNLLSSTIPTSFSGLFYLNFLLLQETCSRERWMECSICHLNHCCRTSKSTTTNSLARFPSIFFEQLSWSHSQRLSTVSLEHCRRLCVRVSI